MYYVYILASRTKVLYTGITNDVVRRMHEHRNRLIPGFASRYSVDRLVHVETCSKSIDAIRREKQLKGWVRRRKIELIESGNPQWQDLADDVLGKRSDPSLRSG
jgi:putative endonuclease